MVKAKDLYSIGLARSFSQNRENDNDQHRADEAI
jgi:hypothetical protein